MLVAPNQDAKLARLAALKEAYGGEALFRPSNASRWMGCPGSVQRIAVVPRLLVQPSSYALEGTAAHKIAQDALTGVRQPEEWTDRMVQVDPTGAAGGIMVDAEMVEAVQFYVDEVYARIPEDATGDDCELHIEQPLTMAALNPADSILAENRGTADAVIFNRRDRILTIVDLKYGRGIAVPASSPQPRNYAVNAMLSVAPPEGGWLKVVAVIVQPRAETDEDRVKVIEYDPNDLMEHMGEFIEAMHKTLADDPPLIVDPKRFGWCHYCPAKAACPSHAQAMLRAGADAFAEAPLSTAMTPMPAPKAVEAYLLPDPSAAALSDIATWLDGRNVIESWIKALEQYAVRMLEAGGTIPGYKLVPRTGRRAWTSEEQAILELRKEGISTDAMYDPPKMKSPAKMEKLLPKNRQHVIETLVTRGEGSAILTHVADRRSALPPIFDAIPPEALTHQG